MKHFPYRSMRLFLWMAVAASAFGLFADVTKELLEGDVDLIDRTILLLIVKTRTPSLTVAAVDLTALGSMSLIGLFTAFAG